MNGKRINLSGSRRRDDDGTCIEHRVLCSRLMVSYLLCCCVTVLL
jgi:hypothetical protein